MICVQQGEQRNGNGLEMEYTIARICLCRGHSHTKLAYLPDETIKIAISDFPFKVLNPK